MVGFVRFFLALCTPLLSIQLMAQNALPDSTITIPTVEISANPEKTVPGSLVYTADSADLANHSHEMIPDLLRKISPIFIRDYGPGTLSSISLRGSGSNHTNIYWNGVLLNQPNLGMFDLSLLPVIPNAQLSVQSGAGSSYYGSGAIGGNILYETRAKPQTSEKISAAYGLGSFGRRNYQLGFQGGNEKTGFDITLMHSYAENDFTFINPALAGAPLDTQRHAMQERSTLLLNATYLLKDSLRLFYHGWFSMTHREIPALMTGALSMALQDDASLRNVLRLQKLGIRNETNVLIAYTRDAILYDEELFDLVSETVSDQVFANAERKFYFKKYIVSAGLSASHQIVINTDYHESVARRLTGAAFGSVTRYLGNKARVNLSVREEIYSGSLHAFSGQTGFEMKWFRFLKSSIGFGRVFRMPTLNDLHWSPGGNPLLKPEQGWSVDGFMEYDGSKGPLEWKIRGGLYYHLVDNWILWRPGPASYWSPYNIQEVEARGSEVSMEWKYQFKKTLLRLTGHYSFTESTVVDSEDQPATLGKQLTYIPYNKGGGTFRFTSGSLTLFYGMTATGFVFTDPLNQYYLDGYTIWDAGITFNPQVKSLNSKWTLRVFNLFDKSYQAVEWRAMPGRYFLLNLEIKLQTSKNKKSQS